jgi:hypothetical protein
MRVLKSNRDSELNDDQSSSVDYESSHENEKSEKSSRRAAHAMLNSLRLELKAMKSNSELRSALTPSTDFESERASHLETKSNFDSAQF